ncbi:MAG: flagellar hook-associated protein FlgK [Candidatus Devosia phytovorans]|uniref:Flagellar hook-associated protein 1 n=1 Tax=Candidatus Devosia phytovorans TaxID=3121372 RepID=A0AAJ5VWK8_9HYPH|nr:flagellar hook-associated protein FlgK [Devosia sp.]WEK05530.1 MAG: flagellar hook-associated protein FlgK [Devosia sp.]
MGLTASLNNAVSGLRINQDGLSILSRNVANAGTPGYHKQSLNVVDYNSQTGSYARTMGANRAFNASLQAYYNRQVSDTASSSVQASFLDRLQGFMGKPGSAGSLDTLYGNLKTSMQTLATSPDDYTARAGALGSAQTMAETLNRLSSNIQTMRQETESQMASSVNELNGMVTSLSEVNARMLDLGMTDSARAALQDQRDRLVAGIGEKIDIQADYRANGTVALMTRSGVGILDNGASMFSFESAGTLDATSTFDADPSKTRVGKLMMTTPSGLTLDLIQQGVLQGGELAGLVTLRDKTLVEAQEQLDEIASGLALAFSTVQTAGTPITGGYEANAGGMSPGNSMELKVKVNGVEQTIKLVNTTQTDLDYRDASGARVLGINFNNGATDADRAANASAQLQTLFATSTNTEPALNVSVNASGGVLQFTGNGTTDVSGLTKLASATGVQGELAVPLFVDNGSQIYTNNLDGTPPQKLGFAARISINGAVVADNRLLVQSQPGQTLGDSSRADYLIKQLDSLQFVSGDGPVGASDKFPLTGNLGNIISQVINFQGSTVNTALTKLSDRQLTLDTLTDQMSSEYGVNVDEEMARLLELQNAYAANARVVSIVKELIDTLFAST